MDPMPTHAEEDAARMRRREREHEARCEYAEVRPNRQTTRTTDDDANESNQSAATRALTAV